MDLKFDTELAKGYKSASQITRVLTESWMDKNVYCPNCSCEKIQKEDNNKPVHDFSCPSCKEQFELKSKHAKTAGKKITDGAYHTMVERIQADNNPSFFFLSYRKVDYSVHQLILVPKHFITTEVIIRRKPLSDTAQRPGWIGCSINVGALPESGKILLIDNAKIIRPEIVRQQWRTNLFLRQQQNKGWLLAIMKYVEKLPETFNLNQIYQFEAELAVQFPKNKHIKDKIRQQLQVLRDQNVIEFSARGQYRKINNVA
ncbi:MAG: DpnI domain-containing protein [Neisseria sp.]|uniref:DpnI domain-containing protein n=1 Tax=Neisseria sp. TaxID=192066 RepID=UPI0026DA7813|nr:DpnI domain-containing protein [Neisseria sp.]MDO4641126.1 DpnI domain-containing protein [Neisseria sp.]